MVDIVCLGEPLLEFNQKEPGVMLQGFGGDTSNCAVSAARQGADVGYITRVGKDKFGESFLALWGEEGIDVSQVTEDPYAPTGIYFVTHDDIGHHFSYYREHSAATKLEPHNLSIPYIADAKFLHVSAISQAISSTAADTVFEAIDIANSNGTKVSYDTNLRLNLWSVKRARAIVHEAMKYCHIALPSIDDAQVLSELTSANAIVDFYHNLGAEIVVLKLENDGAIVSTQRKRRKIAGISVKTIDSNGAGDTFAGAILAELARGQDPFQAAEYANVAAALSTQFDGAVNAIPNRLQTADFLRSESTNTTSLTKSHLKNWHSMVVF